MALDDTAQDDYNYNGQSNYNYNGPSGARIKGIY